MARSFAGRFGGEVTNSRGKSTHVTASFIDYIHGQITAERGQGAGQAITQPPPEDLESRHA